MTKTLIAGIGNVFLGDDGFGVEVAGRLALEPLPEGVRVIDAGIRARHLAYELLEGGFTTAILVDAVARGGAPGTIYLIDPGQAEDDHESTGAPVDGHAMNPETVLAFLRMLGGTPPRVLIVGCEPEGIDERMGLSPAVAGAVNEALMLIRELIPPCV